ncbi:DUF445 domain-containing protein [Bacillus alkalicellulosilyticus]|uniref:DUF445 domain-containing protein n=1 Tax=Alkalihalobacterium alkalicellulosilyticum TaxID=1912214 RepID=UPI0009966719|nr:DUF445 family protein [Bacillus alkalicellulosilyticus]
MDIFILLLLMIFIGAAIGGITNSLAIKMLFRPYRPLYLGRWQVPFTPGLIPKRREELAEQLGRMVVTHLLTAEGIQKKLSDSSFQKEVVQWLQREARTVIHSDHTIEQVASDLFSVDSLHHIAEAKTEQIIREKIVELKIKHADMQLSEVVPSVWQDKMEAQIPELAQLIVTKAEQYFQSSEGKQRLTVMIDRFLVGKGTLGNMISMFLGQDRLVDKVQPEIIKFLQDKGSKALIETLLQKEWTRIKEKKASTFYSFLDTDEMVSIINNLVITNIPVYRWIQQPLNQWAPAFEKQLVDDLAPKLVSWLGGSVANRVEILLQTLHLEEVIKSQVETFAVERLEELVLSISRKEFKMITYLGALLGGGIGLIQGLIVLFIL